MSRQWLILLTVLALPAIPSAGASTGPSTPDHPRRVLIVHSLGLNFQPFTTLTNVFRTELAARLPEPLEFSDVSLETARFTEGTMDGPVAEYIQALSAVQKPDLVVAAGAPAFNFCQRHAEDLFRDVAILGAGIERRHTDGRQFNANTAIVDDHVDLQGIVGGILDLLPSTRHICVIMGSSPLERFWAARARTEWERFETRVSFEWLDDLTLAQIQTRTAALAPHSVVLFALLQVDAAYVPYERNTALDAVHSTANAPVFGVFASDVGHGTVGGRLIDVVALGRESAVMAARILNGESPGAIERLLVPPSVPTFDERELKRWGIPETRLPAGSVVLFQAPTLWETYRVQIVVVIAIMLMQTVLIALYAGNRLRLRTARAQLTERERSVLELRSELRHAGRVSLLGQFTASLAHELGQPLGAILRNAEAAEIFLKERPVDLDEVNAIIRDVHSDATRAGDVISHLRDLLSRREIDMRPLSWSDLAGDVMHIVGPEAEARGIDLRMETPPGTPAVRGDRVHIQQVLLNLIANAMDATEGVADPRVDVGMHSNGNGFIECWVRDNGHGVDPERLESIFEPFATGKEHGMGMGLPISRAIVDLHGGRVWAERNAGRGTTFRFTLPAEGGVVKHG